MDQKSTAGTATTTSNNTNNRSIFSEISAWGMRGYDYVTHSLAASNDTVKGALISQRSNVQVGLETAATGAAHIVGVVGKGAEKLMSGDRAYRPPPLPSWIQPQAPLCGVLGTVPVFLVFAGCAYYVPIAAELTPDELQQQQQHAAAEASSSSPMIINQPQWQHPTQQQITTSQERRVLFFFRVLPVDNPSLAGPLPNFQPRLVRLFAQAGFVPPPAQRDHQSSTEQTASSAVRLAIEAAPAPAAVAPLPANNNNHLNTAASGSTIASDFDMVDHPLGGTLNLNATVPSLAGTTTTTAAAANGAGGALTTTTPTTTTTASPAVATPQQQQQPSQQQQNNNQQQRSFVQTTTETVKRALTALHPSTMFATNDEDTTNNNNNDNSDFSRYHLASALCFGTTALGSLLALRTIASHRGAAVSTLMPSTLKTMLTSIPLVTWGADALSRFSETATTDIVAPLQFAATFSAFGALMHLVPAVVDKLYKPVQELNSFNSNATTTTTTADRVANYAITATHYSSLAFDSCFVLQICVCSPTLPPIIKLAAASHALVTRHFFLCDTRGGAAAGSAQQHQQSPPRTRHFVHSPARWILLSGALRHCAMLSESSGPAGCSNFLSHAFPRALSLALLPIHLAALWLPLVPKRGGGSLLTTALGFVTGTSWSPGALAVANVAWVALYLSQGSKAMETAQPRIATGLTAKSTTTLPLPLFLLMAELLGFVTKLVSHAA